MTITLDTSGVAQPGTLTGTVGVDEDTPYDVDGLALTLNVTPPKSWGQVAGAVTGVNCDGSSAALVGAVVQINSPGPDISVTTDASGQYRYWLDRRNSPLTLIAAADTRQPQTRTVKLKAGQTTTADFALVPVRSCH